MTDPKVAEDQKTIEYSEIVNEIDPFGTSIENLPFRIRPYFYGEDSTDLSKINDEDIALLKAAFPDVDIDEYSEDTFVTCNIFPMYFTLVFQTEKYCFFSTFPFHGSPTEPFFEEYNETGTSGKISLRNGATEDVFGKIKCLKDIVKGKIDTKLAELASSAN